MKILWWVDHLGRGGTQIILCDLVEQAATLGYHQTVISLNNVVAKDIRERLAGASAEVFVIGRLQLLSGLGLFKILRILLQNKYQTSVTFLFWSDVIGLIFSALVKIPNRISSQQSSNSHYKILARFMLWICLRFANLIVLNSISYKEEVGRRFLPSSSKVRVIPNGIKVSSCCSERLPPAEFERERRWLRRQYGVDPDCFLIGTAGRLSHEKRFDIAIDALVEAGLEKVSLVIAGDGPEREFLSGRIKKLQLNRRVSLTGHIDNLDNFYDTIDLYVQVSELEGMPLAVMEAMSFGCPVLGSDISGTRELIQDDRYGALFKTKSKSDFVSKLIAVIASYPQAKERARSAQQRVLSDYSLERFLELWMGLLSLNKKID